MSEQVGSIFVVFDLVLVFALHELGQVSGDVEIKEELLTE